MLEFSEHMALIARFYAAAFNRGYAVALWRKPGAANAMAIASTAAQEVDQIRFGETPAGFVLAPFAEQRPSLFLPAHFLCDGVNVHALSGLAPLDLQATITTAPRWHATLDIQEEVLDAAAYARLVADAVAFIRSAQIAKVVVSRTAPVALPPGFDPVQLFAVLCRRYPNALVSLVTVPGVGAWLGASPELLLHAGTSDLSTVALAGTQPRRAGAPLESMQWGEKEKAEQEMVSAYIRSVFADAGAADVVESGPVTVAAGGVVHLETRFSVESNRAQLPSLADDVLAHLHPTSAVCGMPRNEALQFIHAREGYDRGYYSGYLGPVNIDGCSTLFVNLRCMQLRTTGAALYVGAGVTADSDPAAEWQETVLKTATILDALAEIRAVNPKPIETFDLIAEPTFVAV